MLFLLLILLLLPLSVQAEYLGNLSVNKFDQNSAENPFGADNLFSRRRANWM